MAFYRIDELTTLVLSDNTMSLELGFFDFFLALAGSDENVFESNFFSLCLFSLLSSFFLLRPFFFSFSPEALVAATQSAAEAGRRQKACQTAQTSALFSPVFSLSSLLATRSPW